MPLLNSLSNFLKNFMNCHLDFTSDQAHHNNTGKGLLTLYLLNKNIVAFGSECQVPNDMSNLPFCLTMNIIFRVML